MRGLPILRALTAGIFLAAGGCASSYVTPGRAADLRTIATDLATRPTSGEVGIDDALAKKPLAHFPAAIAVARLQAPGYRSGTAEGFGTGRYSLVTTRDVEPENVGDRLAKMPNVVGIAPISRMLLPGHLETDRELRNAAAQLHAGLLLIYTLDTTFQKNDLAAPLTVVTLGISPNQKATIVTTASAVLIDTRNGYVYGTCEATSRSTKLMGAWGSGSAIDASRLKTEGQAFEKLAGEIEKMWAGVNEQYGRKA